MSAVGTAHSWCRPYGTRDFQGTVVPALKRWANLCCAYGALSWGVARDHEIRAAERHSSGHGVLGAACRGPLRRALEGDPTSVLGSVV